MRQLSRSVGFRLVALICTVFAVSLPALAVDTANFSLLPNNQNILGTPYTTPAATAGLNGTTVQMQTTQTGTFDTLSAGAGNQNLYGDNRNPVAQIISGTSTIGGVPGIDMVMNATNNDGTANIATTFTFSRPVSNVTFTVYDIDGGPTCTNCTFNDIIDLSSNAGFPTAVLTGNLAYNVGTGRITTTANQNRTTLDNATVTFAGPLTTITVKHIAGAITNATTATIGPNQQAITIGNITWGGQVRVQKISQGGVGTFSFTAPTNLAATPTAITTVTAGVAAPTTVPLPAIRVTSSGALVGLPEAAVAGYAPTTLSCTDANSLTPTATFGQIIAGVPTIPAANVLPSSDTTCVITNTRATVNVQVQTVGGPGGPFLFPTTTNLAANTLGTTGITTPGSTPFPAITPTSPIAITALNTNVVITQNIPAGYYAGGYTCTDANAAVTANPVLSSTTANSVTITQPIKAGTAYQCVFINNKLPTVKVQASTTTSFGGPFTYTTTNLPAIASITTSAGNNPSLTSPVANIVPTVASPVLVTEAFTGATTPGMQSTGVTCSDAAAPGDGNATGTIASGPGQSLNIPPLVLKPGADITCVFTHTVLPKLTIVVAIGGAGRILAADQFTSAMLTGATTFLSATTTGAATSNSSAATFGAIGTAYTFTSSLITGAGTSAASQYNSVLSCTNTSTGGSSTAMPTLLTDTLTPQSGDVITCTVTYTPKPPRLQMAKQWSGTNVTGSTDLASIGPATGGANPTAAISNIAVGSNTASAFAIEATGNVITIPAETMSPGSLSNYTTSLACTATPGGITAGSLSGNTLTIAAADAGKDITCTYTNIRKSTTFKLAVSWDANSTPADSNNAVATTGLSNNASLPVLTVPASPPASLNGTAVTVYAGETATLPAETMTGGTGITTYFTTVSCDQAGLSGTAPVNGQAAGNTFAFASTVSSATPITCTYANVKKVAKLTLAKVASPAVSPVVLGTIVTYTYTITNLGNVNITNVTVNDMHGTLPITPPTLATLGTAIPTPWPADIDGGINTETGVPGNTAISCDATCGGTANDGIWAKLGPGDSVTFQWKHRVTQDEIDHG